MKDFSGILIPPSCAFREVLKVIDSSALGFALVVDDAGRLLGTITDGDTRRAMLNSDISQIQATDFMNPAPRVLKTGATPSEQQAFLVRHRISFVPLVDSDDIVRDVATSAHLPGKRFDNVGVVVMAGGLGTRLGALTKDTPKPLLDVQGEPILQKIVKRFRDEGFEQFVFCVNYKAGMIRDHFGDGSELGIEIEYVEEDKRLGTGGALSLVQADRFDHLFVTNADILCDTSYRDMLEFHLDQKSQATMAVLEYQVQIPFGVVETEGFEIRSLREKPTYTHFINAGYYVLAREAQTLVPHDEFFDMPSLFDLLQDNGKHTRIYPTRGEWIDVGRPEDLKLARNANKDT